MSYITITVIAVGLAMDAFAVSISYGCSSLKADLRNTFIISLAFGFFQAGMPFIGWYGGRSLAHLIEGYDHWIAFILLAYIGLKMILEGFGEAPDTEEETSCGTDLSYRKLLVLSVATSIDALAVGFSLSLLKYSIIIPAVIIGIITFLFSFTGVRMGCKLEQIAGKKVEVFGGIILLFIGTKILSEHLMQL